MKKTQALEFDRPAFEFCEFLLFNMIVGKLLQLTKFHFPYLGTIRPTSQRGRVNGVIKGPAGSEGSLYLLDKIFQDSLGTQGKLRLSPQENA